MVWKAIAMLTKKGKGFNLFCPHKCFCWNRGNRDTEPAYSHLFECFSMFGEKALAVLSEAVLRYRFLMNLPDFKDEDVLSVELNHSKAERRSAAVRFANVLGESRLNDALRDRSREVRRAAVARLQHRREDFFVSDVVLERGLTDADYEVRGRFVQLAMNLGKRADPLWLERGLLDAHEDVRTAFVKWGASSLDGTQVARALGDASPHVRRSVWRNAKASLLLSWVEKGVVRRG